jgi:ankyrin repeat protein
MFLAKILFISILIITASSHITLAAETISLTSNSAYDNKRQLIISMYESLYSAIEMDSAHEVQQFVAFGADINYRYEDGKTPLMLASSMGSTNTVRSLLALGANMNLVSKEKMTALDYARETNNQSIIALLHTDKTQVTTQLSDNELIATIQLYLNRLGYIAGDVDGIYGDKTRISLKQFSIDFEQNYLAEISERQIETLFNAMLGNEITTATNSANTGTKKENDLIEIVPTVLIEDLTISETEVINSIR